MSLGPEAPWRRIALAVHAAGLLLGPALVVGGCAGTPALLPWGGAALTLSGLAAFVSGRGVAPRSLAGALAAAQTDEERAHIARVGAWMSGSVLLLAGVATLAIWGLAQGR